MADPSKPEWLDSGDNAWQLAAATLVGLQSMPGLVILYGSIVKKKWAVNSAFMALYAFAAVLLVWVLVGYRMAFGDKLLPFWGKGGLALSISYLRKQAALPATTHSYQNRTIETTPEYPMATLVFYQFMFAAITVILLAGSVLGRMNIKAWMLFVPLWVIFSYTVGAFSLWGGGFLYHWGAIDYSGGFVIHLSSGVSGFTAAFLVGPRVSGDKERFSPNNVLLMLAGAGLLWLGWSGFNGGAAYSAGIVASVAVLNTNISAATSLLTWTCLDVVFFGKPSVIGAVQGMITGLVCVTPGAGLVQSWAAIVMGIFGGSIPWFTMMILHRKSALLQKVDDTLAVFHTHAVSGLLGSILTAFLAEPTLCEMQLPVKNTKGIFYGGSAMTLVKQIVAALFVAAWNVVVTTAILFFIKLFTSLRMSEDELMRGDDAVHGEEAYCGWGDGEKQQATNSGGAVQVTAEETGARGTRFDI